MNLLDFIGLRAKWLASGKDNAVLAAPAAQPAQMGEAKVVAEDGTPKGVSLRWEGEEPAPGGSLVVIVDGAPDNEEPMPAPVGSHILEDGRTLVVAEVGVIAEVLPAQASEGDEETASEPDKASSPVRSRQMRGQPASGSVAVTRARDRNNAYSMREAKELADAVLALDKVHRGEARITNEQQYRQMATGANFADIATRSLNYFDQVFRRKVLVDELTQYLTRLTPPSADSTMPKQYSVDMLRYQEDGIGFRLSGPGCERILNGTSVLSREVIDVRLGQWDKDICLDDYLGKFDRIIDVDGRSLPLGALMVREISDQLLKGLERQMFFGEREGDDRDFIQGYFPLFDASAEAIKVPLGALDVTNVVAAIEGLIEFLPENVRYGEPISVFIPYSLWTLYQQGYRAEFGALPYNTAFAKRTLDTYTQATLVPLHALNGSGRILVSAKANLGYVLEPKESNVDSTRDAIFHKVLMQQRVWGGVNAAFHDEVVVANYTTA